MSELSWWQVMDAVGKKAGMPIKGFVVVCVVDGQTVRYGADYSHDPKVRELLTTHLKRCLREIKKLGSVTRTQGRERRVQ